jgi:DNA repair protein RecO (recombination protein O)
VDLVTPALVLRVVDFGEADRILTLLSRDAGKLSAFARGARRSHKRFGATLGMYALGTATLRERRGRGGGRSGGDGGGGSGWGGDELLGLEAWQPLCSFEGLASDVVRLAHAAYGAELCRELLAPRQPEPAIFDLLVELLQTLAGPLSPSPSTLRAYELKLLEGVGLAPALDRCVACGNQELDDRESSAAGGDHCFDLRRGGVVCSSCGRPGHGGRALAGAVRRALIALGRAPSLEQAAAKALPREVALAARELLVAVIGEHLGRPLKSLEFIAKLAGKDGGRPR